MGARDQGPVHQPYPMDTWKRTCDQEHLRKGVVPYYVLLSGFLTLSYDIFKWIFSLIEGI
jgi:hypothetical protein